MTKDYYLTDLQLEQFAKDGFLGPLPKFAPDEDLDELREFFLKIEEEQPDHPMYGRFAVRDYHLLNDTLMSLFNHPAMIQPLTQLMGNDLLLWRSKSFLKPANSGELGWHQEWGSFNGAEIGNDCPALQPMAKNMDLPWNMTIWFALHDITPSMGPVRFIRGSHKRHYPVEQVSMPDSAFFESPFEEIETVEELVRRSLKGNLILDVDTSPVFKGINTETLSFEEAKTRVLQYLEKFTGEVALPFDIDQDELYEMPMKKGEFVIFYERVMHGSGPNTTARSRIGVNCRVTPSSTLVYPQRLKGEYIDGSNIDISSHYCVQLSGDFKRDDNVYLEHVQAKL